MNSIMLLWVAVGVLAFWLVWLASAGHDHALPPQHVILEGSALTLDSEVGDGTDSEPEQGDGVPLRDDRGGSGGSLSGQAVVVAAEKAAEMEGFDDPAFLGMHSDTRPRVDGVQSSAGSQAEVVQAAGCTTIRCQLDARITQQPGGSIDSPAVHAWLNESAAEYRRDRLIHTFRNKHSPIFATLPVQVVANRYTSRQVWDVAALGAGWQPEELEQLWRIARYEAPSEIVDDLGVGGPAGLVDMLAVGPGDEVCGLQISAGYWDEATAEHLEYDLLFADFQLFALDHCLLAGRYLYENGGYWHWEAFRRNPRGEVRVE